MPSTSNVPVASVIIPTHNRAGRLELTLASFCAQSEANFEVIVVDDGGSDGTRDVVAKYSDRLRLRYLQEEHRGRAAARNSGVWKAAGERVVFCDDDRIVCPDFIARHAAPAHSSVPTVVIGAQRAIVTFVEPDIDVSAADLLKLGRQRPELLTQGRPELVSPNDVLQRFDEVIRRYALDDSFWAEHGAPVVRRYGPSLRGFRLPWTLGLTANLSVPTASVREVGGFDESFVGWGLEDIELHYRLCQIELATSFCEEAVNYHQLHQRSSQHEREWVRNAQHFLAKHPVLEVGFWLCGVRAGMTLHEMSELLEEHEASSHALLKAELSRLAIEHAKLRLALALA